MRVFLVFWSILFFSHLGLDVDDFFFAFLGSDEHVHFHKSLSECFLVVLLFVVGIILQLFDEMSFHEVGHFGS